MQRNQDNAENRAVSYCGQSIKSQSRPAIDGLFTNYWYKAAKDAALIIK